ncbi:tRNA-dihydrouridine synthase 2 [Coemansia sp. BCRC 34490]|nr:tRNA-dihydrouridine synthase 2 [Coemansia sp. BCRC 34490]
MTVEQEGQEETWRNRYRGGFFLAPMVRIGTLPMRLLSLQYGADLVWSPETIDKSIIGSERQVNHQTGVISYMKEGKEVFTTHADERDKVVFQLGSADPETALLAARTVERDVAGFDLNCGCPKRFSIQGGMGAALMSDPDRLCGILTKLVQNVSVPVSCKIRIFEDEEKTLALVRRIAETGVSALTVHCRTKDMRPREKALWDRLNSVVNGVPDHLPVILNGDVFAYVDVERAKEITGATSVMTARGAAANPSIFRPDGTIDTIETVVEYVRMAVRTRNPFHNTKYALLQMYPDTRSQKYVDIRSTKTYEAMCGCLGLQQFYQDEWAQDTGSGDVGTNQLNGADTRQGPKKRCADDAEEPLTADNEPDVEAPPKRVKE